MKLSARNVLRGKIIDVKRGAVTARVRIVITGVTVITSTITNEAAQDLALGDDVYAVINESSVIVARD